MPEHIITVRPITASACHYVDATDDDEDED